MKSILHCSDINLVKDILARENIYETIAYDGSPPLKSFVPQGVWLILSDNDAIAGMINLAPLNNIMWTAHIFIFKKHRGNGSELWAKQAAQWARENLGAEQFLVFTPYIEAKNYAERAGFTYVCTIKQSIRKNGKLLDQYMLELGDIQ